VPKENRKVQSTKFRLDQLLVARGLVESREKAQRAIMAGAVRVGGHVADKADARFAEDADIVVAVRDRYVGRGGHKLEGALKAFAVVPQGAFCIDIGASTGGFTDCLLQHGAAHVWAVDTGHDQLAWRIRSDERVTVREGFNARHMTRADFPAPFDLAVIDVSFISLTLILPAAWDVVKPGGVIIPLIKPQFELGRNDVPRGGVVRDSALHAQAVEKIRSFVAAAGRCEWRDCITSPITGGDGNTEFLACLPVI
jgi:23S rRNA (cytidine1920-2'-O)/16S rRNA (cytidine1409-2'-O)-methyltransferase